MATKLDFYCWVRCTTCRKAKDFLLQNKLEINERDFFKNRFTKDDIRDLVKDKPASEMFNFRSPSFKRLGLSKEDLNDNELIDLMLQEPRLIRRPIVRIEDKVYFGADRSALESLVS